MPTLNINGRRVKVDDSFLSLTPEQQNATVDEIASQLGEVPQDTGQEQAVSKGARQPAATAEQPDAGSGSYVDAGVTWLDNAISGIPVIGPSIKQGSDWLGSQAIGLFTGEDPQAIRQGVQERRQVRDEQYPASALSGNLAGNLAAIGGVGATAAGAEALGMTGAKLLPRVARSAGSSALISGSDTAARGGGAEEIAGSAAIGAGAGAAIPAVGEGVKRLLSAAGSKIYPMINAARNPQGEAARRVGMAISRDAASAPEAMLSASDEAVARANNIPLTNVDRGGETTRSLARSVANQSPEARQTIEKVASDRFGAQSYRAGEFIRRLTNGNVDDLGMQDAIRETARFVNKPAYDRAFSHRNAQQLFTPGLQDLMQSPSVRRAVAKVPRRSADRAAVEGFKEIGNPFTINSKGAYVLRRKANGEMVTPTLQFWDQVKRNLDSEIGKAGRAGDNAMKADLTALKNKLVGELDTAVPQYAAARRGAASYFGAEDAIEAGRKFATTPRSVPEAKKAFEKFTGVEKSGFAIGYASELIDRIKASGDRMNVINSVFKSQSARESMELVFGAQKVKEIEAYVRVEDIVDRLRGAMGNSTTARQLQELGLAAGQAGAGGLGGYMITGDWKGALAGAALPRAGRYVSDRVNANVMASMAKLLAADSAGALKMAVQQAAAKPAYMQALEVYGSALGAPSRAIAASGAQ